jgi:hypothetical protein
MVRLSPSPLIHRLISCVTVCTPLTLSSPSFSSPSSLQPPSSPTSNPTHRLRDHALVSTRLATRETFGKGAGGLRCEQTLKCIVPGGASTVGGLLSVPALLMPQGREGVGSRSCPQRERENGSSDVATLCWRGSVDGLGGEGRGRRGGQRSQSMSSRLPLAPRQITGDGGWDSTQWHMRK